MKLPLRAGRFATLAVAALVLAGTGGCVWFDAAGWGSTPGDYPPRLSRAWTRQLPRRGRIELSFPYIKSLPSEFALPSVYEDTVFIGTSAGEALALEKEGGSTLWSVQLDEDPVTSQAVCDGEIVVFAGLSGMLWGRSVGDGAEVWSVDLGAPVLDAMVRYEDRALVQDAHGALYAVAIADGTIAWKIDGKAPRGLTVRAMGAPVVDALEGRVYWARWDGMIRAAGAASGSVLWQSNYGGNQSDFQSTNIGLALAGNALYAARFSGPVFKIRTEDGITVWQSENIQAAAGPAATYSQVFVPLQGGGMAALDATLGARLEGWGREIPADWGPLSQPKLMGEWLLAVTTETENRWWPPRVTQSGKVMAIDTGAWGQLAWYSKIQTGSYAGLAAGEDWVATLSDRAIAQLWEFSERTDARPDIDYAAEARKQAKELAEERRKLEEAEQEAESTDEPQSFWDALFGDPATDPDADRDDEYSDELGD